MRNLLLSTVTLLVVPAVGLAAPDFSSHTHTTPIELKPISSSSGIKLASVCFLGYGDCGDGGFGSIDGDGGYSVDTIKQCTNEGFVKSCSSSYCMDRSCPYNPAYGKCIKENCPTNSSKDCTGAVVGKNACGDDCKQCCSDSCPSGSKSYTGSYASTTECGNKCYNCNTSCPSGTSTSYSGVVSSKNECGQSCKKCSTTCPSGSLKYTGNVSSYNECGEACRSCNTSCPTGTSTSYSGSTSSYNECGSACKTCSNTCPSGYSLSKPSGCYDTTTTECGNTCYRSKACCSDSCPAGSRYYSGSYAGSTECGNSCYYCSNSCSSGSTSYSGSYAGSTECGSSCYYCSNSCSSGSTSVSCSSGYTKTYVGSTECGSSCYTCVKDNPCDKYTSKSCDYGCASYYSDCSSKCQTCKTNPDCDVTSLSCGSLGCKTTNSCGKCTACNTCIYSDKCPGYTSYACLKGQIEDSCTACGITMYKCKAVQTCSYSEECSGYTLSSGSSCKNGSLSCTACGVTKYKCKPSFSVELPGSSCVPTNCNGKSCCCAKGQSCNGPAYCYCSATNEAPDLMLPTL